MKFLPILLLAGLFAQPVAAAGATATVTPPPRGVSAAPNRAVVTGKVTHQCALLSSSLGIEPEMTIFRVRIQVAQVEGSARLRRGRAVAVLSKEEVPLLVGARVRAVIEYRGDERGGSYWLRTIEKAEK